MTSLPGEGVTPQPTPETDLSLEDRLAEAARMLGQAATLLGTISSELSTRSSSDQAGQEAFDPSKPATETTDIIRPYTSLEAAAAVPQAQLERLSAKNRDLPVHLQNSFVPAMRGFEEIMTEKATPDDEGVKRFRRPPKPPKSMPTYDPENTRKWDECIEEHGRVITWQEQTENFSAAFGITYVRTEDGLLHLAKYRFTRAMARGKERGSFEAGGAKVRAIDVDATCADGKVRKVDLITHTSPEGYSTGETIQADFDFDRLEYNKRHQKFTYDPSQYHFKDINGQIIPGDDMIELLNSYMRVMPTN